MGAKGMIVMTPTQPSALAQTGAPAQPDAEPALHSVPWSEAWAVVVCLSAIAATVGAVAKPGGAGLFVPALCLGIAILAAGFDAATNRIPNPITYPAVLFGLAINCLSIALHRAAPQMADHWLGAAGPTQSLLGLLIFGGIGLVGVIFAGMGGGDMKLLAAIGALLGAAQATEALLCGAVVAVIYSLINLVVSGRLNATLRAAACQFLDVLYLRKWSPLEDGPAAPASRRTIPLAIPLFAGMVLARVAVISEATAWLLGSR
jgi:prepilin peptidase CpaA